MSCLLYNSTRRSLEGFVQPKAGWALDADFSDGTRTGISILTSAAY